MILKLFLLLLLALKTSKCSLVIDSEHQKGLYLSDYCPNMKYCREGSHVMCSFYDPVSGIGGQWKVDFRTSDKSGYPVDTFQNNI